MTELGGGRVSVTGNVAFYRRPEPLAIGPHGKLGVKRDERPFGFARTTHLVPLTIAEFSQAGLDYPIIFSPTDFFPIAVLGLANAQNLYVRDDGGFEPYRYIPAFIRRYPFVFAEDKVNKRYIACIDVEAPIVSEGGEVRLFEGSEPTQYTKDAISFLTSFEQQRRDTLAFVERLKQLDLFDEQNVMVNRANPDGSPAEPLNVGTYTAVSYEKLRKLPAETVAELHQSGLLALIHVHLHSLLNWQMLIQRASDRVATQQAGLQVAPVN